MTDNAISHMPYNSSFVSMMILRTELSPKPTSFLATGFSSKVNKLRDLNPPSASRSASSVMLLFVNTRFVRLGSELCRLGAICEIRFLARSRVLSRGDRGKLASCVIELSVRSIAS